MSLERDQLNTDILLGILCATNINNIINLRDSDIDNSKLKEISGNINHMIVIQNRLNHRSIELDNKEKSND